MKKTEIINIVEKFPNGKEKVTTIKRIVNVEDAGIHFGIIPARRSGIGNSQLSNEKLMKDLEKFREEKRKHTERNNGSCEISIKGKKKKCKIDENTITSYGLNGEKFVINLNLDYEKRNKQPKKNKRKQIDKNNEKK